MREKTEASRETTPPAIGEARTTTFLNVLLGPNSPRTYGVSAVVGGLLAVTGAFYNGEAAIWLRLAFWIPIMIVGGALGSLAAAYVIRIERWAQSRLLSWGVMTLLVGIPMTFVVCLADYVAFGGALSWAELKGIAPGAFFMSGVMAAIFTMMHQAPLQSHAHQVQSTQPTIKFLERLPIKLRGGQIYAVSAEDHYLRIHTSRGSDLILLRLSDAIGELEGIEGSQVHRSWWVARDALESVSRGEGKAVFTLKGGIEAPVSRTFAKALREAGWY